MKNNRLLFISLLSTSVLLTGCVDDDFNLNKINKDMALTWESISCPIQDTEIIKVSDMFELTNSSVVTTSDGDYHIYMYSDNTTTSFEIADFTYQPSMKETHVSEIPAKACDVEVEMEHGFVLNSSEIPSEVKSIERIEIECTAVPIFKFTKTDAVNRIIMKKGSKLILPKWMEVGDYDTSLLSLKDNVFTIERDFDVTADGMSSSLTITAIDFTKSDGKAATVKDGKLSLEDSFTTIGHIVLLQEDIVKPITASHYDISFRCDISSVKIKSVKASIDPKININFQDVNVSEFTTMFPKENTVNLYDIELGVDIENKTPLSTSFSADISSLSGDTVLKTVHLGPLSAVQNDNTSLTISQRKDNKVENLTDLINSRPEKISIQNVTFDNSDEPTWIDTKTTYFISTSYYFDAPIAFCKDLNYKFDYDMNLDVKLNDASIKSLEISSNAVNTIPLGLKMSADILDKDGKVIPGASITISSDVQPGSLSNKSTTPLTVTITPSGNIDYIKTLRFHFTGFNNSDTEGICLNANQTLSLVDIKAKVNGIQVKVN